MNELIKYLNEGQYGYLATVESGKPRVRPFGFMFEEGDRLYFCTNNQKDVYHQLMELPYVEYSMTTNNMVTIRIRGEIKFCEDLDKKEKALNSSELVKKAYKSAENPIFKVFYMEHGIAIFSDFSGQPPKELEF